MYKEKAARDSGVDSHPEELTRTEILCLSMVAEGNGFASIGRDLAVSAKEIEVLLFCAQRKLGAANLLQAISVAMAQGIIPV